MSYKDLNSGIEQAIVEIYHKEKLECLRGINTKERFVHNTNQLLSWHSDVTSSNKNLGSFNINENFDELSFCSDEVIYFLAHMYLHFPFMNDPIKDVISIDETTLYPNYQNLSAKRYFMYADVVSQKLYNYWDRVGDLIASFFPGVLKPDRIFFATIIDAIPAKYHTSKNYMWLKDFKDNQFKDLNDARKEGVHYLTYATKYNQKLLDDPADKQKVLDSIQSRNSLLDFFNNQINYEIIGLETTLAFLEEVNKQAI